MNRLRSALSALVCLIAAAVVLPAAASATNVQVGSAGWLWGNPLPQGNSLRDIAFVPGTTTGYAVGDFGTIIKTTDAGVDWTGLPAGTFINLKRVEIAADGSVIAGAGCVLRISTDAGVTFNRIPFTASEATCPHGVVAFSYQNKTNGYNLLDDGEVQRTTDGGQSFLSNTTGLPGTPGSPTGGNAKPLDITFLADGTTGLASTSDGHIYRTTDGAQTWTSVATVPLGVLRIDMLDSSNGYAVGTSGGFLSTTDGGKTWNPLASGSTAALTGISCISLTSCVLSTDKGDTIALTTDGGATALQQPHPPVEVNAAAWASATQVVGVGNNGGTVVSSDGGINYSPVGKTLKATSYNRLRAGGTSNTAYVVGPNGALAETIDGGKSWTEAKVTGGGNIIDASFPTPNNGWALDSTGALYTTANAGVSWKPIDTGTTAKPNAVFASSASHVLLVGPRGTRLSTNTGVDFTSDKAINLVPLTDVDAAGAAVVVYGPQLILESTNGGKSFISIHKPGKYHKFGKLMVNRLPVERVDFVSSKVGFLLDGDGRVWSTKNQGKSWTELTATGTENAISMGWSDSTHGYLTIDGFGDSDDSTQGFVLRTSDGGKTWHPQFVVADEIQSNGFATGGSSDFLLTKHSNLLYTTTGGDRGLASRLTITPSVRRLTKPETMTVSGTLSPASGFEQVVVSERPAGSTSWISHTAKVDSNGKFTTSWSSLRKGDNVFVAQWQGDFRSDGAGTQTVIVNVGPKPAKHKK